ncbi:MAG: HAD-IB family hydrolase, partial [Actinomyces sp.]
MTGAAFFDLDRTLLPGASGPIISEVLRERGILAGSAIPGQGLLFGLFDLIGETRPSMMLARQGVRLARGWSADALVEAGEEAARRLVPLVQPYAREEMARHRRAGRLLVIATTSPVEVVAPLGAALGVDDVVATRYGRRDGVFDGTVDGHFVWGEGKLAAVTEWARSHGVELERSWAYSDSWYDRPLLSAVGHPVAVNPDPRLAAYALLRRWPIRHLDVPEGAPTAAGLEAQRALLTVIRPELIPYARLRIEGTEHVPESGPVIVAGNHRSYFDFLTIACAIARTGRTARFLAKREMFTLPVAGQVLQALGGIPVDRGTGSDAPLRAAAEALEAGDLVVIMPQGTIPRGRAFFDPELKGRPGVARLAVMTGAPVVPLGVWGTERVWPRSARLPNVWNVLDPPEVLARFGPPVDLGDDPDLRVRTGRVMAAIVDLLPPEAR